MAISAMGQRLKRGSSHGQNIHAIDLFAGNTVRKAAISKSPASCRTEGSSCFSWFRRAQVISDSTLEAEMMSFSGSTRCPPRGMISNQRRIPGTRTDLILVVGTRLASEAGQKALTQALQ